MAVVTERPLVSTPVATGEPEVRPTPVIGVVAALPAVALAVGSLLVGSKPSSAEVVRAILVAAVGRRGNGADRPAVPDPPRPAGARRRDHRRGGRDGERARDPSLPDRRGRAGRRPRHPLAAALLPGGRPPLPPRPAQRAPGHARTPSRRHRHVPHARPWSASPCWPNRDRVVTWPVILLWLIALRLRAGRRARSLRVGRRHRPPAHAVGGLGARGRRRGRARRHRPERARRAIRTTPRRGPSP